MYTLTWSLVGLIILEIGSFSAVVNFPDIQTSRSEGVYQADGTPLPDVGQEMAARQSGLGMAKAAEQTSIFAEVTRNLP